MEKQKNIVCGADIHKRFIMATILSSDGNKIRGRFGMTLDEILRFKEWVINNSCEAVALESTGIYWVPICATRYCITNCRNATPSIRSDLSMACVFSNEKV